MNKYPIKPFREATRYSSYENPPIVPGSFVEYSPVNTTSHTESAFIAAIVFVVLSALCYAGYTAYTAVYNAGRESMKADVIAKMQRDHISFCRDEATPDPSIPQAYENYTHPKYPQKKEEVSNISLTLAE